MQLTMKQYYLDNEGDPWYITADQAGDLRRTYGYTFTECTKDEFTQALTER